MDTVIVNGKLYRPVELVPIERWQTLTKQEYKYLCKLGEGLRAKEAAFEDGIKEETVKNHWWSMRQKLDAKTNSHAVAIAYNIGLLPQGETDV